MKKLYHYILIALFLAIPSIAIISCSDDIPNPDTEPEAEQPKTNTVIIYMGAENSIAAFSYHDLDEMKMAAGSIPEDCQVIVYRDAELKPIIFRLTKQGTTTWKEFTEDVNSADPTTMQSILQDIIKNFPSKKYSLVLWSHGSGWIDETQNTRAIIVDNERNDFSDNGKWINISELSGVLSSLPRMEYIFFDACYMQGVEVASQLYTHTNYIIGSPTEIPGEGAPYHLIMKALCDANPQSIIDGYASGYTGEYGVLLSAVSCEDFPNFCSETAKIIPQIFNKEDMPKIVGIQIYAPVYGNSSNTQSLMPEPYDVRSALHRLASEEDYTAWESQWRKTILYPTRANNWNSKFSINQFGSLHRTMQDAEHYGGISMYIPDYKYEQEGWNKEFKRTTWYNMAGWIQTGW